MAPLHPSARSVCWREHAQLCTACSLDVPSSTSINLSGTQLFNHPGCIRVQYLSCCFDFLSVSASSLGRAAANNTFHFETTSNSEDAPGKSKLRGVPGRSNRKKLDRYLAPRRHPCRLLNTNRYHCSFTTIISPLSSFRTEAQPGAAPFAVLTRHVLFAPPYRLLGSAAPFKVGINSISCCLPRRALWHQCNYCRIRKRPSPDQNLRTGGSSPLSNNMQRPAVGAVLYRSSEREGSRTPRKGEVWYGIKGRVGVG